MTHLRSRILTAVPQTWSARLEIAKAIHVLTVQGEEEKRLRRRNEFAAIRRDCELLAEAVREACRELSKAGFNPNQPRIPAGNHDGGQWTREGGNEASSASQVASDATPDNDWIPGAQYAANVPPGSGPNQSPQIREPPEVPAEQPASRQAITTFLKAAAYFLAGLALASEPAGDFILALEAADWLTGFLPYVYSYLDLPKTLEELQQAAALGGQPGYNIHHIVEQTPAEQDGFSRGLIDAPENLVLIPTLTHWQISAWFATRNDKFGGFSPRDYLRGKSWDERMRVGTEVLIEFGAMAP